MINYFAGLKVIYIVIDFSGRGMTLEVKLKQQKQVLSDNYAIIVENLDPDDVIDELIQDHLIGQNAGQKVTRVMGLSRKEKNRIIFDQLTISEPGTVEKFCTILRRKKRQSFIAEKLEECKYKHYYLCVQAIYHHIK